VILLGERDFKFYCLFLYCSSSGKHILFVLSGSGSGSDILKLISILLSIQVKTKKRSSPRKNSQDRLNAIKYRIFFLPMHWPTLYGVRTGVGGGH